jgi:hypothetical protein
VTRITALAMGVGAGVGVAFRATEFIVVASVLGAGATLELSRVSAALVVDVVKPGASAG